MSVLLFILVVFVIVKFKHIPDQVKRGKYHLTFASAAFAADTGRQGSRRNRLLQILDNAVDSVKSALPAVAKS